MMVLMMEAVNTSETPLLTDRDVFPSNHCHIACFCYQRNTIAEFCRLQDLTGLIELLVASSVMFWKGSRY
jgi:hypothetical protein